MIKRISANETLAIRHKVLWPNEPIDKVKLVDDERGYHYGYFVGDQLVSVISIFANDDEVQFRKFATMPLHQGKGYGSALLEYIVEEAKNMGAKTIWCNARVNASTFYRQHGFFSRSDKGFSKGEVKYTIMERKISTKNFNG